MGKLFVNKPRFGRTSFIGLLAMVFLLGGCVFPEKFTVKIVVDPDASYNIHFEGEVVSVSHANYIYQTKQPLSEEQVNGLKDEVRKMAVNTSNVFTQIQYIGGGRFSLVSDEKYKAGTRTSFLASLVVDPTNDGVISIYAAPLADRQKKALKNIGLNLSGSLTVILPKKAKLISTNSVHIKRSYFSDEVTYSWKITDVNNEPELIFRMLSDADQQ